MKTSNHNKLIQFSSVGVALSAIVSIGCITPVAPDISPETITVTITPEESIDCGDYTTQRRASFGDLHVHTTYSFDGWMNDTRSTPTDAYRFAKSEEFGIPSYDQSGNTLRTVQLDHTLDFAMVANH